MRADPTWKDIEDQFTDRNPGTIQHLTDVWAKRLNVKSLNMVDEVRRVTEEQWSNNRIYDLLKSMEPYEPDMFTSMKPRQTSRPLIIVKSEGTYFLIDGRRRANVFYKKEGLYPVLIVE